MSLDDISFVASIIAVSISAFVAGWTFYRDINDKGILKISCECAYDINDLKQLGTGEKALPLWAFITITNIGRRPIAAKRITFGLSWRPGQGIGEATNFEDRTLPRMLQPGEFVVIKEHADFVFGKASKSIYVYDSFGDRITYTGKEFERLKAHVLSDKLT